MAKILNDKYYTPTAVVKKVIELVGHNIKDINDFDRIIEPSSGGGAFLKELPSKAIGYDVEPHFINKNVKTGNYLDQKIEPMKNSLVIGNPPFDDGTGSNNLHIKFIEKSLEHSEYVVFVLPVDMLNKDNIKTAKLIHSYKLPLVKYSGVALKTCINFYIKRKLGLRIKKIKGVKIEKFARSKKTTKAEEYAWKNKKCDYRFNSFGTIRILAPADSVKASEYKITFDKKVNFEPILNKFLRNKNKNSVSKAGISKQQLIDLIYDTYEKLRVD